MRWAEQGPVKPLLPTHTLTEQSGAAAIQKERYRKKEKVDLYFVSAHGDYLAKQTKSLHTVTLAFNPLSSIVSQFLYAHCID